MYRPLLASRPFLTRIPSPQQKQSTLTSFKRYYNPEGSRNVNTSSTTKTTTSSSTTITPGDTPKPFELVDETGFKPNKRSDYIRVPMSRKQKAVIGVGISMWIWLAADVMYFNKLYNPENTLTPEQRIAETARLREEIKTLRPATESVVQQFHQSKAPEEQWLWSYDKQESKRAWKYLLSKTGLVEYDYVHSLPEAKQQDGDNQQTRDNAHIVTAI